MRKEDFFSKPKKNKCPSDDEICRRKEVNKISNFKNGELTQLNLKSDVLLLVCAFEKFIKVSNNEFGINLLYCVSLPGFTCQGGLNYTRINQKTIQDKDLVLILENNIRGGVSNIMGDCYNKSDENIKILYIGVTNLFGHSMSQPLQFDKTEMWQGHPDL